MATIEGEKKTLAGIKGTAKGKGAFDFGTKQRTFGSGFQFQTRKGRNPKVLTQIEGEKKEL